MIQGGRKEKKKIIKKLKGQEKRRGDPVDLVRLEAGPTGTSECQTARPADWT